MKRAIFSLFLFFLLLSFSPLSASAAPNIDSCSIEKLSDGSYFETIITSDSSAPTEYSRSNSITKTKTTYYKSSDGTIKWTLSVKGTFSYNEKSSSCISCSHSTTHAKDWSIKSSSSKRNGNSATATATASNYSSSITRSVTLTCSANGKEY